VYDWRGSVSITAPPASPPSPSAFATISGIRFTTNELQEPALSNAASLISVFAANACVLSANAYASARLPGQWFRIANQNRSLDQWRTETADEGSHANTLAYPDPARSLGSYHGSLGGEPTLEGFLDAARRQSRLNWLPEFTATAVQSYIRAGFEVAR